MRIDDRQRVQNAKAASSQAVARGEGARFTLDVQGPAAARPTVAPSALSSVGSLLALQEVEEREARRRRSVHKAERLLAGLDQLTLGVLEGQVSVSSLEQLKSELKDAREATDDPHLDDLLAHIELRAEVELAKRSLLLPSS